jgi:hypothetical protein
MALSASRFVDRQSTHYAYARTCCGGAPTALESIITLSRCALGRGASSLSTFSRRKVVASFIYTENGRAIARIEAILLGKSSVRVGCHAPYARAHYSAGLGAFEILSWLLR